MAKGQHRGCALKPKGRFAVRGLAQRPRRLTPPSPAATGNTSKRHRNRQHLQALPQQATPPSAAATGNTSKPRRNKQHRQALPQQATPSSPAATGNTAQPYYGTQHSQNSIASSSSAKPRRDQQKSSTAKHKAVGLDCRKIATQSSPAAAEAVRRSLPRAVAPAPLPASQRSLPAVVGSRRPRGCSHGQLAGCHTSSTAAAGALAGAAPRVHSAGWV
eukprot:360282-Chlamydomonas_euryale.AAC.4